jgi:organic radical activating enzyme
MGIFRDKDGNILNAGNNSIDEIRNCNLVKEVRSCMLRGELHQACSRCNQEDALGIPSRRQWSKTEINQITLEDCIKHTDEDGTIDPSKFGIREADIRFGNFCNIKCRSCWPGESTAWYDDWYMLGKKKFNVNPDTVYLSEVSGAVIARNDDGFRWYEKSDIFSVLSNTDTVKKIHMSGGEPIFIKKHLEFLEMLIESGLSSSLIIDYNSNITNVPKKVLDLWTNFHEIRMGASIDGIGNVNDYIRHPSKWEKIEQNFKRISELKNCRLWSATTVMIYNIFYLPEILEWLFSINDMRTVDDLSKIINLHLLRNPSYLNIQALPMDIKHEIADRLEKWLSADWAIRVNDKVNAQVCSIVNGYIKYMLSTDLSESFQEFLVFTKSLDEIRKEQFSDMLPELATIFEDKGYL